MNDDIFRGFGVKVELKPTPHIDDPKERYSDSFHVIRETLTRIGIASKKTKTLYQSTHVLHKRGQYSILHFKELFLLDGKSADLTEEDVARRNVIVNLLEEWKLLTVIDKEKMIIPSIAPQVRIISYKDKSLWTLTPKYSIGMGK